MESEKADLSNHTVHENNVAQKDTYQKCSLKFN